MRDKRIFYSYLTKDKYGCAKTAYSAGESHTDPFTEMTIRLLEASGLGKLLDEKMKKLGRTPETLRIAIKPNLVSPVPAEFGATTHPQIVEGIIRYLHFLGYKDITVMEGSWVGDDTADSFLYCGYQELAQRYGVKLVDAKKEPAVAVEIPEDVRRRMGEAIASHGNGHVEPQVSLAQAQPETKTNPRSLTSNMQEPHMGGTLGCSFGADSAVPGELKVCRCALETDFLINVPVLKGHCQTRMTCALKNMKGLIPDAEKRHFHAMGLHVPIALLNTIIHQDFIVIDHICGDPEFEDGGNPLVRNCVMAAYDPVAADIAACEALGVDPQDVEYLRLSEMLADVCNPRTVRPGSDDKASDMVTEESTMHCSDVKPYESLTGKYAGINKILVEGEPYEAVPDTHRLLDVNYMVDEVESCSACYSVLIGALDRLKAEGQLDRLVEKLDAETWRYSRKLGNQDEPPVERTEESQRPQEDMPGTDAENHEDSHGTIRIGIGQGCRGKRGVIGVGQCTAGFEWTVRGCPPEEDDIYDMLKRYCGI